ncbi:MAG: hypothetical protein RLY20_3553 [Verrucomicrobiota bacterium]|jgi:hypothetical protein
MPRKFSIRLSAIVLSSSVFLVAGCRVVQNTAELPGKTVGMVANAGKPKPPTVDPVEVQQTVIRFADEFSAAMVVGVDKLRRGTNTLDAAETLQWKLSLDTETTSIASGPNPCANFLDLTVFVTVTRIALEDHWQVKVFGDSAEPMIQSCRGIETNLWLFAGRMLTATQQVELRSAIQNWRAHNPQPENVLGARAVGFASQVAGNVATKPGSVFNLLALDPLAGMDPAVREIAQSRMFAERALYAARKLPRVVRWQTELLTLNTTRLPAVQQVTASVESLGKVADQLPKLVNDQREAAIKQIFDNLATERTNLVATLAADDLKLRATLVDLRQTLDAGNELLKSADTTTKTLDKFMGRFDAGTNAPAAPPTVNTNTRPFDILDYATTAKEVTATIKELNTTITSLDKAVPQIQKAGETFEAAGNRLLNRVFVIGASLILLLLVGGYVIAKTCRRKAQ